MAVVSLREQNLLEAATKMENAAKTIDAAIAKIDSTISDIEADWKDENSKRYLERYAELKQDFPEFKKAIHDYSSFLRRVVQIYQQEFVEPTSESVN